jgi:uncharacterized membrane protein
VFNKRNAAVGYITLKAVSRKLARRRKRSGLKVALFVSLGIVSLGVLAGLAFVLLRRQQGESEQTEGYSFGDEAESEIVGEYVTASPEPIPAT